MSLVRYSSDNRETNLPGVVFTYQENIEKNATVGSHVEEKSSGWLLAAEKRFHSIEGAKAQRE